MREQRGYSRRELARLCGLAESVISKYESGSSEPNIESLKLIAETLTVSADYLLGLTDDPHGHIGDGQIAAEEQAMIDTFRRDGWAGVARLGLDKVTKNL